jgi:hypothetical protein
VLGVAVALSAAACASEPGASSTPTPPTPTDVVLYTPEGEGGFDALLVGRLDRVGECVVVHSDELDLDYAPALPVGTHWDGDELIVKGQGYRAGDEVEWPGGEYGGDLAELQQVPADCEGLTVFIVNQ